MTGTRQKARLRVSGMLATLAIAGFGWSSYGREVEPCPLDPSITEILPLCESGELSNSACTWIPILELMVGGDVKGAQEKIESEFQVPPESAAELMPILRLMLTLQVSSDCESDGFLENVIGMLSDLEKPSGESVAGALAFTNLAIYDPEVQKKIEALKGDTPGFAELQNALSALRELLDRAGVLSEIKEGMNSTPVVFGSGVPMPGTGGWSEELKPYAPLLDQVDNLLHRVSVEPIDELRAELERLASFAPGLKEQGMVRARAGAGFFMMGKFEDALANLTLAEESLAQVSRDSTSEALGQTCRIFRAFVFDSLGRRDEAEELRAELAGMRSLPLIEHLVRSSIPGDDPFSALEFSADAMRQMMSGAWTEEQLRPTMQALEIFYPGISSSEALRQLDIQGPGLPTFEIYNSIIKGEPALALDQLDQLIEEHPNWMQIMPAAMLAAEGFKRKDYPFVLAALDRALGLVERETEAHRLAEMNRDFMSWMGFLPYRLAVDMAVLSRDVDAALTYAERGRSVSIRRSIGHLVRPSEEDRRLSPAEQRLEAKIVESELSGADVEKLDLHPRFHRARLERLLKSEGMLGTKSPLPKTRQIQHLLDPGETMVVFFAGSVGYLWMWIIDSESASFSNHIWSEEIAAKLTCHVAQTYWQRAPESGKRAAEARGFEILDECSAEAETTPEQALFKLLIEPLRKALPADGRLIFVPHGPLHGVPFAALQVPNGRRLIDDFEISVVPSADAFHKLRSRAGSDEIALEPLVLGGPITHLSPLPASKNEARVAASLLGVAPRLCSQATEASLYDRASRASLLHIAAHGVYEPDAPLFSRLQLTPGGGEDGFLHVYEIWDRLDLSRSRLVVLSACDTAAGEPTGGDDIVGLTQAFLVAGAPAVISTLWPVDDRASALLMEAFYRRFLKGEPAGAALREAQLELQSRSEYSAPYFWAGYQLVGDPETRWQAAPVDEEPN